MTTPTLQVCEDEPTTMRGAKTVATTYVHAFKADALAVLALSVFWLLGFALIGVEGEFPLNDDWAYSAATRGFLDTGEIVRTTWTWTPIVTHVLTGAAFAKCFGFSYAVLRASTLFMGWVGIVATYGFGRSMELGVPRSLMAAAVLAVCPVYVSLSYTFMTDVPFTALFVISLSAFVLAVRDPKRVSLPWLLTGILAAVAATASRQVGVATILGLVVAVIIVRLRTLRALFWCSVVGAAFCVGALLVVERLIGSADDVSNPVTYYFQYVLMRPELPKVVVVNLLMSLDYFGFFLLPVVPWLKAPNRRWAVVVSCAAGGLLVQAMQWRLGRPLPSGLNIISDFGLGAPTLSGVDLRFHAPPLFWFLWQWLGATTSLYVSWVFLTSAMKRRKEFRARRAWSLVAFTALAYATPIFISLPLFDRYLIPVVPMLAVSLLVFAGVPRPSRRASVLGFAALLLFAIVSIAGTRDYMVHHRTRAVALEVLEAAGVPRNVVDGGFEYNGRYFSSFIKASRVYEKRFWLDDNEYVVTYEPSREGYEVVGSWAYRRWLPPIVEEIHLLHRLEPLREPEAMD